LIFFLEDDELELPSQTVGLPVVEEISIIEPHSVETILPDVTSDPIQTSENDPLSKKRKNLEGELTDVHEKKRMRSKFDEQLLNQKIRDAKEMQVQRKELFELDCEYKKLLFEELKLKIEGLKLDNEIKKIDLEIKKRQL